MCVTITLCVFSKNFFQNFFKKFFPKFFAKFFCKIFLQNIFQNFSDIFLKNFCQNFFQNFFPKFFQKFFPNFFPKFSQIFFKIFFQNFFQNFFDLLHLPSCLKLRSSTGTSSRMNRDSVFGEICSQIIGMVPWFRPEFRPSRLDDSSALNVEIPLPSAVHIAENLCQVSHTQNRV